jgi:hypothetical protein
VSFQGLEEIKDMLFYSGKYEGGMVCGPCPHMCIFANEPPELEKFSSDRWKVFKITEVDTPFGRTRELRPSEAPTSCADDKMARGGA